MKMSELFRKTDEALDLVEAKRAAHDQAVAAHAETAEKAKAKLVKDIDLANAKHAKAVADAQIAYDEAVAATAREQQQSAGELESAQAELDVLRAQVGTLLGLEKANSRATVSG